MFDANLYNTVCTLPEVYKDNILPSMEPEIKGFPFFLVRVPSLLANKHGWENANAATLPYCSAPFPCTTYADLEISWRVFQKQKSSHLEM